MSSLALRSGSRRVPLALGCCGSAQSWRELLIDIKQRGLEIAPDLAVGDGALGFWKAIEEVFPSTRHQRCWVHKTANVLNKVVLSPAVISRLTAEWQADYDVWQKRDLSARRYMYVWADWVYLQARMEKAAECRSAVRRVLAQEGSKGFLEVALRHSTQVENRQQRIEALGPPRPLRQDRRGANLHERVPAECWPRC